MKTRIYIAVLLSMIISVVVFGVGAIVVLATPGLKSAAAFWLPIVMALTFIVSPVIGWIMAPHLRARYDRRRARVL